MNFILYFIHDTGHLIQEHSWSFKTFKNIPNINSHTIQELILTNVFVSWFNEHKVSYTSIYTFDFLA